jgi:hypothetical protein
LAIKNVAIIVLILSVIAPTIINETDPAIMDVYPNYLWVYLHQHFTFNIGILLVVFLHHRKKPALANPFRDWIKDVIVLVRKPFN